MRSGRLSNIIHVGTLTTGEAAQALSKIVGVSINEDEVTWELSRDKAISTKTRTGFGTGEEAGSGVLLSTVYKEARARGWTPLGVEVSSFTGVVVVEVPEYLKRLYPEGESFDGNGVSRSDKGKSEHHKKLSRLLNSFK